MVVLFAAFAEFTAEMEGKKPGLSVVEVPDLTQAGAGSNSEPVEEDATLASLFID